MDRYPEVRFTEGPWKSTFQLRRSTSPKVYLSSEPLLLLVRKRWSGAKGLVIRELANLLKDTFKGLTDVSKLRLYSLRAGRATSPACAGIPDRLFKRHGRWASENAKDGYVKDDFNSRLLVTRSLGI